MCEQEPRPCGCGCICSAGNDQSHPSRKSGRRCCPWRPFEAQASDLREGRGVESGQALLVVSEVEPVADARGDGDHIFECRPPSTPMMSVLYRPGNPET